MDAAGRFNVQRSDPILPHAFSSHVEMLVYLGDQLLVRRRDRWGACVDGLLSGSLGGQVRTDRLGECEQTLGGDIWPGKFRYMCVIAVGAGADGFEIASLFAQSSGSLGQGGGDDCLPDSRALLTPPKI